MDALRPNTNKCSFMATHSKLPCMNKRVVLVVAALLLLAITSVSCGRAAVRHEANSQLLFTLRDHGSTNTPAWVLAVNIDGSGVLTHDRRGNVNGNNTFKAGTFDVRALEAVLGKLDVHHLPRCAPAEAIAPVEVNMGSVSFGSSATMEYRGRSVSSFCLNNHLEVMISDQLAKVVAKARP